VPDERRVVIKGDRPPRLEVSYTFAFSLYQHVLARAGGRSAEGAAPVSVGAGERAARLMLPLGAQRFFEYSLLEAGTVTGMAQALRERARIFADDLAAMLAAAETSYRRREWADDERLLDEAVGDVERLLGPHKDELISMQLDRLSLGQTPEVLHVALVPVSYERTGAYSHPTVVSVGSFRGLRLVEAILHEVTHVAADLNRDEPRTAHSLISRYCRLKGRPTRDAFALFHLLLFHASGALVREVLSPDYVPYAAAEGIYERTGALLRARITEKTMADIWSSVVAGRWELPTAMMQLVASLG
jgi:hypothetical protein